MMDKSLPIQKFPLKEFKEELDRDHAEFEASVQNSLAKLIDQNPQIMNLKVEAINGVKISLILGTSPPKGVLLEYLQQEQSRIYKEFCSQVEAQAGRPVSLDEVEFPPLTLPSSEIDRLDRLWDETRIKTAKEVRRCFLMCINKITPEAQTVRPDIQICLYLRDCWGAHISIYMESKGQVLADSIIKLPTVTFDTNVVREWWENRAKVEHVNKLLELGKNFAIDLAVTGRIRDDIPFSPLAEKINELPNLNIHDIGSVIRFGHWKVGIDAAGNDEFKKFFDSLVVSEQFSRMNIEGRPDWRDWDHLHTHYRYKRDYFLTWDKKILHFANELQENLGIVVMKPECYLSKNKADILPEVDSCHTSTV